MTVRKSGHQSRNGTNDWLTDWPQYDTDNFVTSVFVIDLWKYKDQDLTQLKLYQILFYIKEFKYFGVFIKTGIKYWL